MADSKKRFSPLQVYTRWALFKTFKLKLLKFVQFGKQAAEDEYYFYSKFQIELNF